MSNGNRHFESMDALRGIAALLVCFYHAQMHWRDPISLPSSYLAVDLFFMLSGFVIALRYEGKIGRTMSIGSFMRTRLVRLYPLAMLGSMAGATALFVEGWLAGPGSWQLHAVRLELPLAVGFIPRTGARGVFAFPLDPPMWSLFFELWVNLAFALLLPRLSNRVLMSIAAVGGLGVCVSAAVWQTLNVGVGLPSFAGGVARTLWAFPVGMLICRWWEVGAFQRVPRLPTLCLLGVFVTTTIPSEFGAQSAVIACLSVLMIFPAVLILATSSTQDKGPAREFLTWLGFISYAVYALHVPLFVWVSQLTKIAGFDIAMTRVVSLSLVLPVSALAIRLWDEPVRSWLNQPRQRWPVAPQNHGQMRK